MINGKVIGAENLARTLSRTLPDESRKELSGAVKDQAQQMLIAARANAPTATGKTKAALKIKTRNKGLSAQIGVLDSDRGFVARLDEFGVKPHEIDLKNRKALAFQDRFAARVHHPGTTGSHWLLGLLSDARTAFQARLRDAMIEALRRVNL